MKEYETFRRNKEILFLFFLTIVFFWKIITNSNSIIFSPISDLIGIGTYARLFYAESIINYGELPLWNPYIFSGMPFIGNPQSGILYPPYILFLFFKTDLVFGYIYIIDLFLMGFFTYLFSRTIGLRKYPSLITAITFMFSETVISRIYAGHLNIIDSFVWLPLIFLLCELAVQRRKLIYHILIGASLALLFLPGHIQFGIYGLSAGALYFFLRSSQESGKIKEIVKRSSYFIIPLIVFASLFAVQLFPTLEFSSFMNRAEGMKYEDATKFSISPEYFITFIIPEFFGTPLNNTYFHTGNLWEQAGYIGVLPLILAIFGAIFVKNKYTRIFCILTVLVLFYSIKGSPLFSFLYHYVPGFDMFRAPARSLFIYAFSMSILAGFGTETLLNMRQKKEDRKIDKIVRYFTILLALSIVVISLVYLFKDYVLSFGQSLIAKKYTIYPKLLTQPLSYWYDFSRSLYDTALKASAVFVGFLACITYLFSIRNKISQRLFKIAILFLIVADLFIIGLPFVDTKPVDEVFEPPQYIDLIKNSYGKYRVFDASNTFGQHIASKHGIELVNGYDPSYLKEYQDFLWLIGNDSHLNNRIYDVYLTIPDISDLNALKLLNTKYIISKAPINISGVKQIYFLNNISVYEIENTMPRAYIVHNAHMMKNKRDVLEYLRNDSFDMKNEVLLYTIPGSSKNVPNTSGITLNNAGFFEEVELIRHTPNRIDMEFNAKNSGFLVLSEIWYPGWKAYDNGREVEIFKVNYLLRSVYVESGRHNVNLVYSPDSYMYGKAISVFSLVIFGTYLLILLATRYHSKSARF